MVLLGVIAGAVIDLFVSLIPVKAKAPDTSTTDATKDAEGGTVTVTTTAKADQSRVLSDVLVGDFMHNFCDGIFMGVGFSACPSSVAWTITIATILHEYPQELGDYIVLTDPKLGGLKPAMALVLNFVSGLSIILGIIIVMAQGDLDPTTLGMLLTLGGGIYLEVGLAACMARVHQTAKSPPVKIGAILMFCVGALIIGLVLLDHEHCVAEDDDSHAGHDHG